MGWDGLAVGDVGEGVVWGFDAIAEGGAGAVGYGQGGELEGFGLEGDKLDVGGGITVVAGLEDVVEFFLHLLEGVGVAVYGEAGGVGVGEAADIVESHNVVGVGVGEK